VNGAAEAKKPYLAPAAREVPTTREVAEQIGVTQDTLTRWVRDGRVKVETIGEGRQRRIIWTDAAITAALEEATRPEKESDVGKDMIEDLGGAEFLANYEKAVERAKVSRSPEVVIAHATGVRAFPLSTSLREVVGAMENGFGIVIQTDQ
jgi:excisionase family DNA binding protein